MTDDYREAHRNLPLGVIDRKEFLIYEEFLRITEEYERSARFRDPPKDGSGLDLWSHIVAFNQVARLSIRSYFYKDLNASWCLTGAEDSQEEMLCIFELRRKSKAALVRAINSHRHYRSAPASPARSYKSSSSNESRAFPEDD